MSKPLIDPQTVGLGPAPTWADAELLGRAQAGDALALQVVYERYLPSVWRFVYSQLRGDVHAAEDVTAETFLAAIRSLGDLQPDKTLLSGWLIGIARHKLADFRRKAVRTDRVLRAAQAAVEVEADGVMRLLADETRAEVAAIMDRLRDEERIVLEWKYLDDLAVRDIAARLGRSDKAVEGLLFRARQHFREEWEQAQRAGEDVKR